MLSKENNRPLCQEYTTEMYTKEMQELEKSTVDDYAPEDVLQLDGNNKETNFAVYNNDTVVIEENENRQPDDCHPNAKPFIFFLKLPNP